MKSLFATAMLMTVALSISAHSEKFKVAENGGKTRTCISEVVNVSNERPGNNCVYLFTPWTEGRPEGTLVFEFIMTPDNDKSVEIKNAAVAILRDIKNVDKSRIELQIHLSNGEYLMFNAADIPDWQQHDWRQIVHVVYSKEEQQYRSSFMFPLEHLYSSTTDLDTRVKKRHDYILKQLQNFTITKLVIIDRMENATIELEIPFQRPTANTFCDMITKVKKMK